MLSYEESRENPERGRIRPPLERSPLRSSTERDDPTSTANYDSKVNLNRSTSCAVLALWPIVRVGVRTETEPLFESGVPPPRLQLVPYVDENPQQAKLQPNVHVLLAAR